MIHNKTFFNKLNELGRKGVPFLFIIDFEANKPFVYELNEIPEDILYMTPASQDGVKIRIKKEKPILRKMPVTPEDYKLKFEKVLSHIQNGDTYLINLTQPTRVITDISLKKIYEMAVAPYKLYFRDQFVVFSPESFIKIKENKIYTFPMKGTINADIPDAKETLLNDPKEISEHNTIVDLMRNDLSRVARNVKVDRFRYIETITTNEKTILQASSQISGNLQENYSGNIGDILSSLLPAGSVTGAPKEKTVEILKSTEGYNRSYYTGVFGVFDGKDLDSAVMIRFVEKDADGLVFKSGGGITFRSEAGKEYQEMIDKVYVPLS